MDWNIWRLVLHPRISETKEEIEYGSWTLEDVEIAHQLLDMLEDAEQEANHGSS